jgi:hypothetical protein
MCCNLLTVILGKPLQRLFRDRQHAAGRCFYKPQPMRSLEEIKHDILALERETEGLLKEIVGGPA